MHGKLKDRELSFRSIAFIAISTDLKIHTKSHLLATPANDLDTIRTAARRLARAFLEENPVMLRRVGIRVADFVEGKGQKTLGEF